MKLSGECCCGCNTKTSDPTPAHNCPLCGNTGIVVRSITVAHLVADECRAEVKGEGFRICMNEDCDVVYYQDKEGARFLADQIRVPVWFKKDADPKYACYCSKVTEAQVIEAVAVKGAQTVQEVNAITGAMRHCNCIEENPLGACCHARIQELIDSTKAKGCELR